MALKLTNNATSTLASSITASQTTIAIQGGDAGSFPTLGAGDWCPVTVVDGAGNMEIMKCTARSGANLTVTRAQEGTTGKIFAAGARIDVRLTAAALAEKLDAAGYTAADVLAKLLTVDGIGSMLDADLLDGQQGAFYQNAGNMNAGILNDARLPTRLGTVATVITDWNDATSNGWYKGNAAGNAPPSSIVGTTAWVYGEVIAYAPTYVVQKAWPASAAIADSDTKTAMRVQINGSWSAWFRLRMSETELDARYLKLAGGTLTGPLTLAGAPTVALHAATKDYVDSNGAKTDYQVFTASGTWTKPAGLDDDSLVVIEAWGGGGGGSTDGTNGGGGGGGAYVFKLMRAGDVSSSVSVTVGAGGSPGNGGTKGGNSTFGSYVTAYGGGGGDNEGTTVFLYGCGGAGGGWEGQGASGGETRNVSSAFSLDGTGFGGGGGGSLSGSSTAKTAHDSVYGGGGGSGNNSSGSGRYAGCSIYGGGGGSSGSTSTFIGTSVFGGNGGYAGTDGEAPGGGGGRSGNGARGEVRVRVVGK